MSNFTYDKFAPHFKGNKEKPVNDMGDLMRNSGESYDDAHMSDRAVSIDSDFSHSELGRIRKH